MVSRIEQKTPGHLKMGKNLGTIDASAYLIMLGVTRCPSANESNIEYQKTELAFYTMEWAEDNKHIKEVKNPRVIETGYRSPQLTLWTLGPDEWLLFLKLPDYAGRKKRKRADMTQLPLPEGLTLSVDAPVQ